MKVVCTLVDLYRALSEGNISIMKLYSIYCTRGAFMYDSEATGSQK